MPQYFKGDETEIKYYLSGETLGSDLSLQKDEFFDDAFECFILGEVLWDNEFSPLVNAIPREIFREAFASIFDSFVAAGSFEGYLNIFRKIFGADVDVTFTVPAPGKLEIQIEAAQVELTNFITRYILNNQYNFDNIVDEVGDQIVFQTIKGFETQAELETMLFELVPVGVYTTVTLTIGS